MPSSDAEWAAFLARRRERPQTDWPRMPPGYLSRGMRLPTVSEFNALHECGADTCEECRTKDPDQRTCPHPR